MLNGNDVYCIVTDVYCVHYCMRALMRIGSVRWCHISQKRSRQARFAPAPRQTVSGTGRQAVPCKEVDMKKGRNGRGTCQVLDESSGHFPTIMFSSAMPRGELRRGAHLPYVGLEPAGR